MKNKNKNNYFGRFFTIFLTSFLLGFIFSQYLNYNLGLGLLKNNFSSLSTNISKPDMSKFWEVYNSIQRENFDRNIQTNDLIEGAIYGLVDGLGDEHSEYFNIKETESFNDTLSGDFEGIGAVVKENILGVEIDRVLSGSPAKKYGVLKGDIVITANDISLKGMTLIEAINNIKGPAGTSVDLEILRAGESEILNILVVRDKITIPSVETQDLENTNIGYIRVNMFGEYTSREFKKSLDSLRDKKGIIIDLRDNGGGYLVSAIEILSSLVPDGEKLLTTKHRNQIFNSQYESNNPGNIYTGKIVVLINENSASASEITAGALGEYDLGILVGTQSYGKGSVQKPINLSDGSLLKITVAKWFTPKGVNIDEEGVSPDIEILFEKEDYTNNYDRQKEEAILILQDFIQTQDKQKTIDNYFGT